MKMKLLFLALLITFSSCQKDNAPIQDAKKDQIIEEVKEVVDEFTKHSLEPDLEKTFEFWYDSPDFIFLNNGYTISYDDAKAGFEFIISELINQKATLLYERYAVLDVGTVLYTADYKWEANYKDGLAVLQDPLAMLLIFRKIDEQWKIVYFVESYNSHKIANTETSKNIDQQKLHKMFLGTWQGEAGQDTTLFWQVKPYGKNFECTFKYVYKGKAVEKGIQQWGYDENSDNFLLSKMSEDKSIIFYTSWFTSSKKCMVLLYDHRTGSYWTPKKWEIEFTSPETIVQTKIINNNPVKSITLNRVK